MQVNDLVFEEQFQNSTLRPYNCLVDIVRAETVETGIGQKEVLTTLISGVACTIRWKSGMEKIMSNKTTYYLDATLSCRQQAADITTNDRVLFNGDYFEILDVRDFHNLNKVLSIDIRRIQ